MTQSLSQEYLNLLYISSGKACLSGICLMSVYNLENAIVLRKSKGLLYSLLAVLILLHFKLFLLKNHLILEIVTKLSLYFSIHI
jgi:hypothetical protein